MKVQLDKICPNCFEESFIDVHCKRCHYQEVPESRGSLALPKNTIVNGRYLIGRVLGAGGFGITYKAYDILNQNICAVKEFVPLGLSIRMEAQTILMPSVAEKQEVFEHGKRRFLEEARLLKDLRAIESVVQITDYFEENQTAYYVMEYLEGMTLKGWMKSCGGKVHLTDGIRVICKAGAALEQVHNQAEIFHRDISPENIMITKTGHVKLIDFGSAKHLVQDRNKNLSVVLKLGFAPPEQYLRNGVQGRYTDVYALASTFYYCVTGVMLPEAMDRLSGVSYQPLIEIVPEISAQLSFNVDNALMVDYRTRTQTVAQFINGLRNDEDRSSQTLEPDEKTHYVGNIRPFLQSYSNDEGIKSWYLTPNTFTGVGRSMRSDQIKVTSNEHISKLHCQVCFDEDKMLFYIVDLSVNGVFVGGTRLLKGQLYKVKIGQEVILGQNSCSLKLGVNYE